MVNLRRAEPFLKWVGSKRKLIPSLKEVLPTSFNRYFEPFLGSAALYFHLAPEQAFLSDANKDLIATYKALQENCDAVIAHIKSLPRDRSTYYRVRKNRSDDPVARAAEFIYLNKNCWNGLYRVNLRGEFNVPYGAPKGPNEIDFDNLRACAVALRRPGTLISCADFSIVENVAEVGDFVFFDPPYVTTHNNNGFIEYNENIFSWDDQVRLADLCSRLLRRGVRVMVTNADHPPVRELYSGFSTLVLSRHSTLASSAASRRRVTEVAFYG